MTENIPPSYVPETLCVHAGMEPEPHTGAIMTPVFLTSTYVQSAPGVHKGYDYSRAGNPTRKVLEDAICLLEKGKYGFAFASGCAATDIILSLTKPGQHILSMDDVYGGTRRLLTWYQKNYGVQVSFVDLTGDSVDTLLAQHIKKTTKMLLIESPSNPLLKIADINKIAQYLSAIPVSDRPLLIVDNTFATPIFQNPLELGADIVLHSGTKYLGGHSDLLAGLIVTRRDDVAEACTFLQKSKGNILSPMECFLVLRGIKTLSLRMKQHEKNALFVSQFLTEHPKVEKVLYPGLSSHPNYATHKRQMRGSGGIITLYIRGGIKESELFLRKLQLFSLAESLGGVESLVDHPFLMTHASIDEEARKSLGITNNLIRLSVGIEDPNDLVKDLDKALSFV